MEIDRFSILKRTYGSGTIVFIPQQYLGKNRYQNICDEMKQSVSSFETEKEAIKKIEEFKKFEKDSKIISEERLLSYEPVCKKDTEKLNISDVGDSNYTHAAIPLKDLNGRINSIEKQMEILKDNKVLETYLTNNRKI